MENRLVFLGLQYESPLQDETQRCRSSTDAERQQWSEDLLEKQQNQQILFLQRSGGRLKTLLSGNVWFKSLMCTEEVRREERWVSTVICKNTAEDHRNSLKLPVVLGNLFKNDEIMDMPPCNIMWKACDYHQLHFSAWQWVKASLDRKNKKNLKTHNGLSKGQNSTLHKKVWIQEYAKINIIYMHAGNWFAHECADHEMVMSCWSWRRQKK